ncbi:hypothetical protein V8E36_007675 [Tilletia maclaganii]
MTSAPRLLFSSSLPLLRCYGASPSTASTSSLATGGLRFSSSSALKSATSILRLEPSPIHSALLTARRSSAVVASPSALPFSQRLLASSRRTITTTTAAAAPATTANTNALLSLAIAGAALILYATSSPNRGFGSKIHCEPIVKSNLPSSSSHADPKSVDNPLNPDGKYPQSQVNLYQLSFGTITGLCAGIFIKKGLKALAFVLGAGYVLLQYLSSQCLVSVNWGDSLVDRASGSVGGEASAARGWMGSKAQRIWARFSDFLTADFQPRATFLAGLALGFRLG